MLTTWIYVIVGAGFCSISLSRDMPLGTRIYGILLAWWDHGALLVFEKSFTAIWRRIQKKLSWQDGVIFPGRRIYIVLWGWRAIKRKQKVSAIHSETYLRLHCIATHYTYVHASLLSRRRNVPLAITAFISGRRRGSSRGDVAWARGLATFFYHVAISRLEELEDRCTLTVAVRDWIIQERKNQTNHTLTTHLKAAGRCVFLKHCIGPFSRKKIRIGACLWLSNRWMITYTSRSRTISSIFSCRRRLCCSCSSTHIHHGAIAHFVKLHTTRFRRIEQHETFECFAIPLSWISRIVWTCLSFVNRRMPSTFRQ